MKITLTRLEDAVPEMVELEFVNDSLMTSIVLTLEEAENIRKSLGKVLKDIATPVVDMYGMPEELYKQVVTLMRVKDDKGYRPNFIQAIKEVRNTMGLGLKEAKDVCDKVKEALERGEI